MSTASSSRTGTHNETIAKLKNELAGQAAKLKATEAWPELERVYRKLIAIEDQAGTKRTTLEELLGVAQATQAAQITAKPLELAPEAQQETEAAAEIEKGA